MIPFQLELLIQSIKKRRMMQRFANVSGVCRHFSETVCSRRAAAANNKATALIFTIFSLFVIAFVYSFYINSSVAATVRSDSSSQPILTTRHPPKKRIHYSLNCTASNKTQTCPKSLPLIDPNYQVRSSTSCPDYFRWIYEDLKPWKKTGITMEMVERAKKTANFRLTIIDGKAYVEIYEKAFQTRDVFTIWGIIQLLKKYPGKIPDLDLMFDCYDWPVIFSQDYDYKTEKPNANVSSTIPPPLFRYCANESTLDIVFPDWSFWGWPEINIKPWDSLLKELKEGNGKVNWLNREPYAYWKGNPEVADTRKDLLKCNVSDKQDWSARIFAQDWLSEIKKGYKQSNLADQCRHRYKIYIEGSAWSVSEKYILACDSLTLIVTPHYYDIFTRSLVAIEHYWPIKEDDKCRSIKFAVSWGNSHKKKAQQMGKAASNFIHHNMTMDHVYDYMFHLLNEYAKLLRFKPTKPENSVEFCSDNMGCHAEGREKKFMMESMVNYPSDTMPCNLPPPMDTQSRLDLVRKKINKIRQVEMWQNSFWDEQSKRQ